MQLQQVFTDDFWTDAKPGDYILPSRKAKEIGMILCCPRCGNIFSIREKVARNRDCTITCARIIHICNLRISVTRNIIGLIKNNE